MGFLKSFEEFGENLVELGLILGRTKGDLGFVWR
jgi:hypothetical protein